MLIVAIYAKALISKVRLTASLSTIKIAYAAGSSTNPVPK
jgi:hypothetical protein